MQAPVNGFDFVQIMNEYLQRERGKPDSDVSWFYTRRLAMIRQALDAPLIPYLIDQHIIPCDQPLFEYDRHPQWEQNFRVRPNVAFLHMVDEDSIDPNWSQLLVYPGEGTKLFLECTVQLPFDAKPRTLRIGNRGYHDPLATAECFTVDRKQGGETQSGWTWARNELALDSNVTISEEQYRFNRIMLDLIEAALQTFSSVWSRTNNQ